MRTEQQVRSWLEFARTVDTHTAADEAFRRGVESTLEWLIGDRNTPFTRQGKTPMENLND